MLCSLRLAPPLRSAFGHFIVAIRLLGCLVQAELYTRMVYQRHYGIDGWAAEGSELARHTFPSVTLDLSFDEATALYAYCLSHRRGTALPTSTGHSGEPDHVNAVATDGAHIMQRLSARLNEAASEKFGQGAKWFVKLGTPQSC
jgi:hypothetical protein